MNASERCLRRTIEDCHALLMLVTLSFGQFLVNGPSAAQDAAVAPAPEGAPAVVGEIDPSRPPPLRFFAVGDVPYSESEVRPLQALLAAAAAQHPPFIVHVGDIKSGSSRCTDANLYQIAAIFRALPVPVVYTPGDNEWTDCDRFAAGGFDPRARLARVREVFFGDPGILRLADLGVVHADSGLPEVYRFLSGGVLFVALHIVGSDNGYRRDDPAAMAEFAAREAANEAFLNDSLAAAKAQDARALVLLMQADPVFERVPGPRGFRRLKSQLVALVDRFPGPVLVLHGDTHSYRQDRPLLDPEHGLPDERLERVEVPGSPTIGGVWITVDPQAPEPFVAEPVYEGSPDTLGSE
jgi:hypothetical protein